MICDIKYDEKTGIVETIYTGLITYEELQEIVLKTLVVAEAHQATLFLGNCTTLEPNGSLFEIYNIVRFLEPLIGSQTFKEAILLPTSSEAQQAMRFYETASRNRWLDVRVFPDRETAVTWLTH